MLLIIRSFQANSRRCIKLEDLPPVIDFTEALTEATKKDQAEIPSLEKILKATEEE
jgi:hypothetical protein